MIIRKKYKDFWMRVGKTFAQGSFGAFAALNLTSVSFDKHVWLTVLSGGLSAVASMFSNITTSSDA